jgi:ABC-type phosphate transport system substrate-binding protein
MKRTVPLSRRLILVSLLASSALAEERAYRLVAHPSNPTVSVDRRFLADAFLKKVTRWPTGERLRPVDLSAESLARKRFSDDVLNRSVPAVKSYWQQQIFSGRDVPPPELDSDEQVLQYVLKNPSALGYVSAAADVGQVKVLTLK